MKLSRLAAALALALTLVRPAAADEPKTLVFTNSSEYDTLDPLTVFDIVRVASKMNLYDNLYRYLDNPPVLTPWIAESHTLSDDRLTYRFKIREGIAFHDGAPLTADDVVYSIERMMALNKGPALLFKKTLAVAKVRAVDPHTVEIVLPEPSATFLATTPEIFIVNSKLVKGHEKDGDWGGEWLSRNVAGSGSYVMENWDPAVGWSALRNPKHFMGWGPKYVERIQFKTVREQNSQVLGMLRGDYAALVGTYSNDQIDRMRKSPNVKILEQDTLRLFMFHINNKRPPFDNIHVRKALNYAFDYDAFNKNMLGGTVTRNLGPIPAPMWGYPQDLQGYSFDLEKAKAELALWGGKFTQPIAIHGIAGTTQTEQAATILQNGLRKLGIESRIQLETFPVLANKARTVETTPDIWTSWSGTTYPDPHNWIGEQYSSIEWGSWKTGSWYQNPEVDAMLATALKSADKAERQRLYEDATRKVVADAASIWIYNQKWFGPVRRDVQGFRYCPVGGGHDFRWVWLED